MAEDPEVVDESFGVMRDDAAEHLRRQDEAHDAATLTLTLTHHATLTGNPRGPWPEDGNDGGVKEEEEVGTDVDEVSDMPFSLMCEDTLALLRAREEEAEAALLAAELEAYDVFDKPEGEEEEGEGEGEIGVPAKMAAGSVVVQRPATAGLVHVRPAAPAA